MPDHQLMSERVAMVIGQSLEMYGLIDPNGRGVEVALKFTAGVVFAALREATPEVIEAFYSAGTRGKATTPLEYWQAMIDEARRRKRA